jgi:hypothetical protein
MHRRDLILGGAVGLAAVAATARAQTAASGAPTIARSVDEVPKRLPGSPYVPGEYGETLNIMFKTSTDLNAFMPEGITCVDPHRAFIKAQRKKGGTSAGYTPGPGAHGLQIGIATMATSPMFGKRQRNILMWESVEWGVGSTLVSVKRWADAEMTYIFEQDRKLIAQGSPVPINLEVQQHGYPLLTFNGFLDGKERAKDEPYGGMYIGGEPGADLLSLTFDACEFSRPVHGTGTLSFGSIPIEREPANPAKGWPSTLLKDIQVEGCIFQDISFTRSYGTEFETVRKALPVKG